MDREGRCLAGTIGCGGTRVGRKTFRKSRMICLRRVSER